MNDLADEQHAEDEALDKAPKRTEVRAGDGGGCGPLLALVVVVLMGVGAFLLLRPTGLDRLFQGAPVATLAPLSNPYGTVAPSIEPVGAPPLRIAVAPVISPEASLTLYQGLVDYLSGALNRPGELLLRPTYAEVNTLVRHGHCDLAFICTWAFVQGERDFGMQAMVVPVVDGATTYRSFFVVPTQSSATTLLDLHDKRFGSSDTLSTSGWLWPVLWLKRRDREAANFFSEHIITGSHDRSVEAVASGSVDGVAVDSIVYQEMARKHASVRDSTRVIYRSPPFGMPPVVNHPSMAPELRRKLQQALVGMHQDAKGRAVLEALNIDRFQAAEAKMWESLRKDVREWEAVP